MGASLEGILIHVPIRWLLCTHPQHALNSGPYAPS
jgi:hypothetical protein